MMRSFYSPKLLLTAMLLSAPLRAAAEKGSAGGTAGPTQSATCAVEVFYSWERTGGGGEKERSDPIEVFYDRFEKEGTAVELTKKSLQADLQALQTKALQACTEKHGEKSRCVARLLRTSGRDYQSLDFQSRSLILKSIHEECERTTGQCISTRASEITCTDVQVSATASPSAGDEKAGKSAPTK